MAIAFNPAAAGSPWFTAMETEVNIVYEIGISSDAGTIDAVDWVVAPEPPQQVVVARTPDGIGLSAVDLDGLFPIILIKYLRDGVTGQCLNFDGLPADAEEVLEYRKDPNTPRIYTLTLTVTETDALTAMTSTCTASYEFWIEADYSPGRDRLRGEVDARR